MMTDAPSAAARRFVRPGWLDLRLLTGVVLVVASVLIGASVVAAADHRVRTWVLARDVSPGTVLQNGDVRSVPVQLGSAEDRYLTSSDAVAGKTTSRPLRAGELLPRAALAAPESGTSLAISVRPENAPRVGRGDRITIWLTTKSCRGVVLLSGVPVQEVRQGSAASFGSTAALGLVVRLSLEQAHRAVTALDADGVLVRAGVLSPDQAPEPAVDDLTPCWGAGR
jgi:hypothetical protein